jgi:hypothetical protein
VSVELGCNVAVTRRSGCERWPVARSAASTVCDPSVHVGVTTGGGAAVPTGTAAPQVTPSGDVWAVKAIDVPVGVLLSHEKYCHEGEVAAGQVAVKLTTNGAGEYVRIGGVGEHTPLAQREPLAKLQHCPSVVQAAPSATQAADPSGTQWEVGGLASGGGSS